jgi:hypothetical protein
MSALRRLLVVALLAAPALILTACGGDGEDDVAPQAPAPSAEAVLEHVHGLGVDDTTGTLYIATHTGLFRSSEGEQSAQRVGRSTQDIMGFSVVEGDRFIGSGHPDPTQDLPPNLGLIESRDGGRSWDSVSLLGEADFHVLRSAGRTVYGFDGTQERLMVSADGGRDWEEETPPAAMFDLAIHPSDDERVVASTQRGIFGSSDGGGRWRSLRDDAAGLLAWPRASELYLVDGQGGVARSDDGGREWRRAGSIGGQPVAFTAAEDGLYVALGDDTVKRSADGGATWVVRTSP